MTLKVKRYEIAEYIDSFSIDINKCIKIVSNYFHFIIGFLTLPSLLTFKTPYFCNCRSVRGCGGAKFDHVSTYC